MTTTPSQDITANFQAAYSWFHRTDPALTFGAAGGMTCCYAPGGLTDFNVALPDPAQPPEPSAPAFRETLLAVREFFHDRAPAFSCWTPQGNMIAPAAKTLEFATRVDYMSQHRELAAPVPVPERGGPLTARRVATHGELDAFADLIAAGWSVNAAPYRDFFAAQAERLLAADCPKHLYIGWVEDSPACCMELFMQPECGVAGVYYVTTHRAFRRQGYAMRLQAMALEEARQAGYRAAVVISEPDEHRVMARLGFVDCGLWHEYIQDA